MGQEVVDNLIIAYKGTLNFPSDKTFIKRLALGSVHKHASVTRVSIVRPVYECSLKNCYRKATRNQSDLYGTLIFVLSTIRILKSFSIRILYSSKSLVKNYKTIKHSVLDT